MGNEVDREGGAASNANQPTRDEQPIGSAAPSNPPTWHPDEQNHRRHERRYWKFNTLLTFIAVIGAVASAWFAWQAVKASQDAAASSRQAAQETKRQADIAHDAEIRQLRAYLHVSHGSWQQYPPQIANSGPQYGAEVYIGHAGSTPAYNVRIDATIEVGRYMVGDLKLGDPITMGGGTVTKRTYSILYGTTPTTVSIAMPFEYNAMRSTTVNDPLIGDNRFYMHGVIRYLDIFGLEKTTPERRYEFCWVFHPEREPAGSERGCEKYNKPG